MESSLTDNGLPGFWQAADVASLSGQKWSLLYSRFRLGGSVLAALGATLSFSAGRFDVAAAVVLFGFLVALSSELASWVHQPEKTWYDGRAMAESTKTLAWRYGVAADPFPISMSLTDAESELGRRLAEITAEVSERIILGESVGPMITAEMKALRALPFVERRKAYIEGRTKEQQVWYALKAKENRRKATGWRIALVVTEVTALVIAALRVFGGWNVDLAGLMAAFIAAGGAWVAVKQFSPLASAYSMAAAELAIQAEKLQRIPENEWSTTAADAEEAISREHTMWLASRTGRSPRNT